MKKFLSVLFVFMCSFYSAFAQGEETGPLTGNPELLARKKAQLKVSSGTFDSTFIYYSDTLSLPFFDEFSKNHFQQYSADFSDPGVTFDKKYRILDNTTLLPIANGVYYTAQQTFRRTYDVVSSTFTDENFSATPFKVGDLSSYPVTYATTDLYPPYYIYDTVGVADESDTVWISGPEFYQDSATQFFAVLNDASSYWLDSYAYHNYRYAVEPWSLGVVTFDGLDETGFPYAIGTTLTNYADVLTSKPLDLGSLTASDSVYFSFLYQAEGFGDIPEASDSLVLEFYAKELDQWFRVWSAQGSGVSDFSVGHLRLSDPKYFKKGFQFRFRNYGALSGSLDHFNLDYVHLRALSGYQDTLFKDYAFVYPVGSLLKDYTSVPWDHFKNDPVGHMTDQLPITVRNGSNLPENNLNGQIEVFYNSISEGTFVMNGQTLSGGNINYGPRTTYTSYHDLSGGYEYDPTKPETHPSFDVLATAGAQFPNLAQNDSTWGVQYFANYYSHDDGSAEAAYGPTGTQARLAIRYEAYEADSLIGVNIHFVPSVNDVSNKLFLLTVWDDNGGVPGAVLYEDDVFFPRSPEYHYGHNTFQTYFFKDTMKVAVGTVFYVGWRQFDADRLNVGLDRNLDHSDRTFYSLNGGVTWNQSSIPGSVMIRPIYSTTLDAELSAPEIQAADYKVYPNPTSGTVQVDTGGELIENILLVDLTGAVLQATTSTLIDLSEYPSGVYFLKIVGARQRTVKVIKF